MSGVGSGAGPDKDHTQYDQNQRVMLRVNTGCLKRECQEPSGSIPKLVSGNRAKLES